LREASFICSAIAFVSTKLSGSAAILSAEGVLGAATDGGGEMEATDVAGVGRADDAGVVKVDGDDSEAMVYYKVGNVCVMYLYAGLGRSLGSIAYG
jgi:hypothetical protein